MSESASSEAARQRSQQQWASAAPPREALSYEDRQREIECVLQLRQMGYQDGEKILAAAKEARGDTARAIEILLDAENRASEAEASSWSTA